MSRRRRPAVWLALIALAGFARGLFWVVAIEVPGPADEAQHFHYVQSLAGGDGPPEVGRDRLSRDALELEKRSATLPWRSEPIEADPDDRNWGAVGESYEGAQPPLYYALLTPVYGAVRPLGVKPALYGLRVASVLFALMAVPISYLLARELFPHRPAVWPAAPAVLVMVAGFNANLATVTNDALIVPIAGAALVPVARAIRVGLTRRLAVSTGVLLGLALLTKATAISLVPLVVVGAGIAAGRHHTRWPAVGARFLALAGGVTALVYAPWVVWNLVTYHAPSGSDEMNRILGPLQPDLGRSLSAARHHLAEATRGFWEFEVGTPRFGSTMRWWTAATVLAVAVGLVTAVRRRQPHDRAALAWLTSAWPFAFAGMLLVIFVLFSGQTGTVGRHLYPALIPVAVGLSAGAVLAFGPRVGVGLLAVVVLGGALGERADVHRYLRIKYTDAVIGNLAPAVEQPWGDHVESRASVATVSPCPARAAAFGVVGDPPAAVLVRTARGPVEAAGLGRIGGLNAYAFPVAVPGTVTIQFPRPVDLSVSSRRSPVMRLYCRADDPRSARFTQLFDPDHVDLSYATVRAWPWLWIVLLLLGGLTWLGTTRTRSDAKRVRPA